MIAVAPQERSIVGWRSVELERPESRILPRPQSSRVDEKRFGALLRTISQPAILINTEGVILDLNAAAAKVLGCETALPLGESCTRRFPPESVAELTERMARVLAGLGPEQITTWMPAGEHAPPCHMAWELVPDATGGLLIVGREISDELRLRSELEASLKELQQQKRALDLSAIVAITDARGIIQYANEKFCEISRYSREELVGKDHRIINSGYHSHEFFRSLWKTISSGKVWTGEIRNRAKDGNFYWVYTTIVPFLDDLGRPFQYVSIHTDITEQKLADQRLEEEHAKTLQAEKMASLGEMAAGIAHELGNPLAAIRGRVEFLEYLHERGTLDRPRVLEIADTIKGLADRMTRIIRGMRSFARDGSSDPFQWTDIGQVLRDILEFTSEKMRKLGIEVRVEIPDAALQLECRETQISQVLVNLLHNSCDAVRELPGRWIRIECRKLEKQIEIAVTDSGSGIPPELREKIFQPFFTTKPVGQGTGLGLGIARSIARGHGGDLVLESESPNTRFVLRLPMRQG